MPAQILHTLFGEDVLAAIGKDLSPRFKAAETVVKTIQGTYHAVFALGCQGPDIFYHNQMTRPVALEYGVLLHHRSFGDFAAALLKAALQEHSAGITPLNAYALGFMTHGFLDRIAHPYIVYKSSIGSLRSDEDKRFVQCFPKGSAHAFFERIIDVLMLERLRGMPVCSWDQDALAQVCAEVPQGLRELLMNTLLSVFPERTQGDAKLLQRINNTLHDCAAFYHLTDPQKTALHCGIPVQKNVLAYVYPEQLPLSIDYLNLKHLPWFYPTETGKEDTCSFPELYDTAVKTGVNVLLPLTVQYLETGIIPPEAGCCLGNSGLSIQDETGKPCAPTRVETLPLDVVLGYQRVLREWA